MLILTRKEKETLVILDEDANEVIAEIVVVRIAGDQIKLGVNADIALPVHRKEIWDRIQEERKLNK